MAAGLLVVATAGAAAAVALSRSDDRAGLLEAAQEGVREHGRSFAPTLGPEVQRQVLSAELDEDSLTFDSDEGDTTVTAWGAVKYRVRYRAPYRATPRMIPTEPVELERTVSFTLEPKPGTCRQEASTTDFGDWHCDQEDGKWSAAELTSPDDSSPLPPDDTRDARDAAMKVVAAVLRLENGRAIGDALDDQLATPVSFQTMRSHRRKSLPGYGVLYDLEVLDLTASAPASRWSVPLLPDVLLGHPSLVGGNDDCDVDLDSLTVRSIAGGTGTSVDSSASALELALVHGYAYVRSTDWSDCPGGPPAPPAAPAPARAGPTGPSRDTAVAYRVWVARRQDDAGTRPWVPIRIELAKGPTQYADLPAPGPVEESPRHVLVDATDLLPSTLRDDIDIGSTATWDNLAFMRVHYGGAAVSLREIELEGDDVSVCVLSGQCANR